MKIKICRSRIVFNLKMIIVFLATSFKTKNQREAVIENFEQHFACYIGSKYAVSVASGKIALYLCLSALNAKGKDKIIVPAYTVAEVIDIVVSMGLEPVFVDIDLNDGNMDAEKIEEAIDERAKFILMTHIYGNPCNIYKILELAKKYDLEVIEDAAQACGAEYDNRKTGGFGKLGYFSFGILKNINTLGGGMVVTNDEMLAQRIKDLMRDFKPVSKIELFFRLIFAAVIAVVTHPAIFTAVIWPVMRIIPYNMLKKINNPFKTKQVGVVELDKLKVCYLAEQAALGLLQLNALDKLNLRRMEKAKLLDKELAKTGAANIFQEKKCARSIYLNYVIRVKNREDFKKVLFKNGIDASEGFIGSCAHMGRFKEYWRYCPNSRVLEEENLYVPIYPALKDAEILKIAKLIRLSYGQL
ncbi:MAG: aminotransferase class I/II-fold pyridoxal phosphate-dependent enzyme [Candidatus Omnitrophica bacterium]|nr:aminotransferase class I/II-fold pyridoxal phosphate-dependent enzyme [Candidatus Omnitrophota bacterium]MBU1924559.1 aminotransferase class I/II-fold pyridoxal phosphate-dependent enzyme [Candidatus Omnitrophota bacterium]